jgi:hypothetical protein
MRTLGQPLLDCRSPRWPAKRYGPDRPLGLRTACLGRVRRHRWRFALPSLLLHNQSAVRPSRDGGDDDEQVDARVGGT